MIVCKTLKKEGRVFLNIGNIITNIGKISLASFVQQKHRVLRRQNSFLEEFCSAFSNTSVTHTVLLRSPKPAKNNLRDTSLGHPDVASTQAKA